MGLRDEACWSVPRRARRSEVEALLGLGGDDELGLKLNRLIENNDDDEGVRGVGVRVR